VKERNTNFLAFLKALESLRYLLRIPAPFLLGHFSTLYQKTVLLSSEKCSETLKALSNMESYDIETLEKLGNPLANLAYTTLPNQHRKTSAERKLRPKPVHSMKAMYCSLSMCSIMIALLGLSYLLFDPLVKHMVLSKLVLRNNSGFAELWKNPPIKPHFKVYFFNLTNAEDFINGKANPHVQEIGPYTYHQKWIKENLAWHDNGTMAYSTRKIFTFIPELSITADGKQLDDRKDNLTVINVPAFSAMHQVRLKSYFEKVGVYSALELLDTKMILQRTPEQMIWGYHEPLLEAAALLDDSLTFTSFGFFTKKNETNPEKLPKYTMYTGENDPYKLSSISSFNGKNSLSIWNSEEGEICNKVQGSDGATFNPYIQQKETLWFFNDQLCRSMPLVFQKNVQSAGNMPAYRFGPRKDVFRNNDLENYPQNACFCRDEPLCEITGNGMFAVSKCQFQAPIVLSWAHFLHADKSIRDKITGMTEPELEKHGFWFDIQPITGTTMSAKARIQINVAVQHSDYFDYFKGNDTIVPILWFEEGIDELGPEIINEVSQAVTQPPQYKSYILFILLGVTICTMIVGFITMATVCMNAKTKRRNRKYMQNVAAEFGPDKLRGLIPPIPATTTFKKGHAHNPSQGSGKFLLASSEDSSRQSSANHSRNSSNGSTPPFMVDVIMNPEIVAKEKSPETEEQERLLDDQRSKS